MKTDMKIKIKGNFDSKFITSALFEVDKLLGIPDNIEEILIIDNPKYFNDIMHDLPEELRGPFKEAYEADLTSVSITSGVFDLVIISINPKDEAYLERNKKALVGLISHELMHIIQRRKNLDLDIRKDAIKAFKKFSKKLNNLKYNKKEIDMLFAEVGSGANFTLKDIYANIELIKRGLGKYILEDYTNLYKTERKKFKGKIPLFYNDLEDARNNLSKLRDAIIYEINLISAIAPFVYMAKKGDNDARKLVNMINKYFEANIYEISYVMDDVIQYSVDHLRWSSKFRQKYFTLMFEKVYKLLTE